MVLANDLIPELIERPVEVWKKLLSIPNTVEEVERRKSQFKEAQVKKAKQAACGILLSSDPEDFGELCDELDLDDGWHPLYWLVPRVEYWGHGNDCARQAVYEMLSDNTLQCEVHHASSDLFGAWEDFCFEARAFGEYSSFFLPMVKTTADSEQTRVFCLHGNRPTGARDHLWLSWREEDGQKAPEICKRWNQMSEAEREQVSPDACDKITERDPKYSTVKQGLKNAREEKTEFDRFLI